MAVCGHHTTTMWAPCLPRLPRDMVHCMAHATPHQPITDLHQAHEHLASVVLAPFATDSTTRAHRLLILRTLDPRP